jgi:hypothetical protein
MYMESLDRFPLNRSLTLSFVVGHKDALTGTLPVTLVDVHDQASFVCSKPVPELWKADLNEYLEGDKAVLHEGKAVAPVGYMTYVKPSHEKNNTIYSRFYYPRSDLGRRLASKLPYFMEAMAVRQLKALGFTHVFAGNYVSFKREMQLDLVGIHLRGDIAIDEWLKGMGRGIRIALERGFSEV